MSNSLLTIQAITNQALSILEDELGWAGSLLGLDRHILSVCDDTKKLTKVLK